MRRSAKDLRSLRDLPTERKRGDGKGGFRTGGLPFALSGNFGYEWVESRINPGEKGRSAVGSGLAGRVKRTLSLPFELIQPVIPR